MNIETVVLENKCFPPTCPACHLLYLDHRPWHSNEPPFTTVQHFPNNLSTESNLLALSQHAYSL